MVERFRVEKNRIKQQLMGLNLSQEALIDLCAASMQSAHEALKQNDELISELNRGLQYVHAAVEMGERSTAMAAEYRQMLELAPNVIFESFKKGLKQGKAVAPRKGAAKRHEENRAMKADVFSWLDANMSNFKSMDKAAEAIASKVAPIAVRTARDWVGEWKKLRSASKA